MTIEHRPTVGPQLPISGSAGRFAGWEVYHPGDVIKCPGTMIERRAGSRTQPGQRCPHAWGRPAGDTVVLVRLKPFGTVRTALEGQIIPCPTCRQTIQFKQVAAAEAA